MKVVKIVFGAMALALLLGLAGMIYLAAYLDRHKGLLEATVSKVLGREVQIEGDIELAWSMTPSIAIRGFSGARVPQCRGCRFSARWNVRSSIHRRFSPVVADGCQIEG